MTNGHPDRGELLALVDGELGPAATRRLDGHLRDCEDCRRRLQQYRRTSDAFTRTARAADRSPPTMEPPRRAGNRLPYLRAAAVVLTVGLGAALLTVGPLRALTGQALQEIADLFRGRQDGAPAVAVTDTTPAPDPGSAASIRIRDGRLRVGIYLPAEAAPPAVRVRRERSDWARVEVTGSASFETSPGRLDVRVERGDTVRVFLPEGVIHATVTLDDRPLLRVEGRRMLPAAPADTVDGEIVLRPRH